MVSVSGSDSVWFCTSGTLSSSRNFGPS